MPSQTNEQALEASIEKKLTGVNLEEINASGVSLLEEPAPLYKSGNGYYIGQASDFNAKFAHKADITKILQYLCKEGYLISENKGRWTSYHLSIVAKVDTSVIAKC